MTGDGLTVELETARQFSDPKRASDSFRRAVINCLSQVLA